MVDAECVANIEEQKTEELAKDPEYVKEVATVVEEWVRPQKANPLLAPTLSFFLTFSRPFCETAFLDLN